MSEKPVIIEAQYVFDKTVEHLRKQGRKALKSNGKCAIRGDDGCKCALGLWVKDEDYVPEMDGNNWPMIYVWGYLRKNYEINEKTKTILDGLRRIHDNIKVENWEPSFHTLADDEGLVYSDA